MFRRSLGQLKTDIMRANSLVQEANFLAEEMEKKTKFSVTLQIPPANLSPNRRRGAFVSEPAILVKRTNSGSQIWSMEKLENKLIDMREMYQEHKERILNGLVRALVVYNIFSSFPLSFVLTIKLYVYLLINRIIHTHMHSINPRSAPY